ncbi:MAG: hypothetical protein LBN11_07730 [Tannerella sp.]|jgi:hypothetical protein|nr:hypothetical protein [Tannerella sp.]
MQYINKTDIFVFIFFICNALLYAQEDLLALHLNENGVTIDSLIEVIENKDIPYKEKIALIYECRYKRDTLREKQIDVLNQILEESKKQNDVNGMLFTYVYLADLYHAWEENHLFDVYADSADLCMEDATNPLSLARYHFTKGTQAIDKPYGRKEGYKQFEKAIDSFNQIEDEAPSIEVTLYNITVYTANTPDTASSKRIIGKIENILDKNHSSFIEFLLYSMKSDLHHEYFKTSGNEAMLDSAIHFEVERVNIYNEKSQTLPKGLDYDILQSYLLLAEYYSQKQNPDWDLISSCIKNAENPEYSDDYYILSRIKYIKSIMYYGQKKLAEAEKSIYEAEKLLSLEIQQSGNTYSDEFYCSDEMAYADLHCKILMTQENYKEALIFNELKNSLVIKLQNMESREIEFLYDTEKEDIKIEQLKIINHQQLKTNIMLITAIGLFIVLIVLLWSLLKMMTKNFKNRYALISTEKRETEINLKINEERAIKSLLEKYEVLSDNRLKEIEIEGKNREMEILLKEKEALNNEIEAFTKRINHFDQLSENNKLMDTITGNSDNQLIIEDLISILNKKLPPKPEYIDALHALDGEYITFLKSAFTGNLSKSYIRYCLCFVIGMEISEVAECAGIEPSSVYVLRYRLKKRFGLANNENLDDFLRLLPNSSQKES